MADDPLEIAELAADSALTRDKSQRRQRMIDIGLASLLGFLLALIVTIPVVFIQSNDNRDTAAKASTLNCVSQASARPQGNARGFALAELLQLGERVYNALPPKFKAIELAKINADALKQAKYLPGQFPEPHPGVPEIRDFSDLTSVISPLPLLHCERFSG